MSDTPRPKTPFERALADFERRREQYAREQEQAAQGDDDQAPFRALMVRAGRADPPAGFYPFRFM
jgi:hypothetical protein